MIIKVRAIVLALVLIGGAIYGQRLQKEQPREPQTEGRTTAYAEASRNTDIYATTATGSGSTTRNLQTKTRKAEEDGSIILEEITRRAVNYITVNRGSRAADYGTLVGNFKLTAYTAGVESTGKGKDHPLYGHTALSGSKRAGFKPVIATPEHTVAADWSVLPPGTVVHIEGVGVRTVEDKGGAVKGKHIDLYIEDLQEARSWGVQHKEVHVIRWGEM